MFNNLLPEEVDSLVRGNAYFKLPKGVAYYSDKDQLSDCSLENTKPNEGWLFNTKGRVLYYYDPHRESLKMVLGEGSVVSKPHKVSMEGLQQLLNREVSLSDFEVDLELWLAQYIQELTPTTRMHLLVEFLKQGYDLDLEGLVHD